MAPGLRRRLIGSLHGAMCHLALETSVRVPWEALGNGRASSTVASGAGCILATRWCWFDPRHGGHVGSFRTQVVGSGNEFYGNHQQQ